MDDRPDRKPEGSGSLGPTPTWFRVLTAEGRGAIAVVRVWGPGAVAVVDRIFRPHRGRPISGAPPGRLRIGRAGVGLGDEVVVARLESSTPTVEIQCHGGPAAIAAVVRSLEAAGAGPVDQDRLDVETADDRIRTQAMDDLAAAPTLRAAEILLDQAHGAMGRSLGRLIGEARRGAPLGPSSGLLADLDALIGSAAIGTRLRIGWKVVIAGRPNVGKSRLFNAIAGYERSIVNPRAGVTRDVVSIRTALGGWPVELCDTAGERDSTDAVERLGIGRARQERRDADLVLVVLDRSEPLQPDDRHLLETTVSPLLAANKCDLPRSWDPGELERGGYKVCSVSAETGDGLDRLVQAIASRLVPGPPAPGQAVPFRPEHLRALEGAREDLIADDREGLIRRLESIGGFGASP